MSADYSPLCFLIDNGLDDYAMTLPWFQPHLNAVRAWLDRVTAAEQHVPQGQEGE